MQSKAKQWQNEWKEYERVWKGMKGYGGAEEEQREFMEKQRKAQDGRTECKQTQPPQMRRRHRRFGTMPPCIARNFHVDSLFLNIQ